MMQVGNLEVRTDSGAITRVLYERQEHVIDELTIPFAADASYTASATPEAFQSPKLPLPVATRPLLSHESIGQPASASQTVSRSVQPFL